MTIYRITPADIETFTIVTNPSRHYVSSSNPLIPTTGSVYVFPRRSPIEKDVIQSPAFVDDVHDDAHFATTIDDIQSVARVIRNANSSLTGSFYALMSEYLRKVDSLGSSTRKSKVVDIVRFTPSNSFTKDTVRKMQVRDILNKYYRTSYPTAHWAYTNYHSLNFLSMSLEGGKVQPRYALLYPNIDAGPEHAGYASGTYSLSGAFSFDFYVNPRRTSALRDSYYDAGTIFHLSSSYAVSLVSGSAKDPNGNASMFRVQLQLSHSADIAPSLVRRPTATPTYPHDLVFWSNDNSLKLNHWHHVIVRWGTNLINDGTGSFIIDGEEKGTFVIPSGTVAPRNVAGMDPSVLTIGAYYSGSNVGTSAYGLFFAADPAERDGLEQLVSTPSVDQPTWYRLINQLNAEVHDLSIRRHYMSDVDMLVTGSSGPSSVGNEYAFYLPPFFMHESPMRKFVGDHGGILQTPFFEVDGTTDDPFNVAMAFGVGGHYINIENFLRDFASNVYPRCHLLTASVLTNTTQLRAADEFLYDDPLVRQRNLFLMPCDDGTFTPSFRLLASESVRRSKLAALPSKYVDDTGVEDLSLINLTSMLSASSMLFGGPLDDGTGLTAPPIDGFVNNLLGFSPETPGITPGRAFLNYAGRVDAAIADDTYGPGTQAGAPLTIYQRLRDDSSNQVTFFDISNIYYGKRIYPGSFSITDPSLTGSNGFMSITLKDDGRGNIYRADCETEPCTWNSVGNIYYDEGVVVIKSPHLNFFGKNGYEITLKGDQNIHVLKVDVLAPANQLNSSSNPSFLLLSASGYTTDTDPKYVYISGINLHDDNYNVIAKAQFAQPILKRHGAKLLAKIKFDF